MRDAYYWVSGIFIVVSVIALYQQYQTNKLLKEIKIVVEKQGK